MARVTTMARVAVAAVGYDYGQVTRLSQGLIDHDEVKPEAN